jgi:nitrite reductase (NO-forming) / hydroxylamine reductase
MIGTDPDNHPDSAWRVVDTLEGLGGGSLFLKTHPNSRNLWVDYPLNPSPVTHGQVAVFDLDNLEAGFDVMAIAQASGVDGTPRITHPEFNKDGTEVWLSVWNSMDRDSAIVVIDDRTREVKHVIRDDRLITPTGKFNVYNTQHEIY